VVVFNGIDAQRLLALFVLGWLFFNFPLLGLWDLPKTVFGLPLLPLALFVFWALLIGTSAWLMERTWRAPGDD
jgi:hypothetical protein